MASKRRLHRVINRLEALGATQNDIHFIIYRFEETEKLNMIKEAIQKEANKCHQNCDKQGEHAINRLWHEIGWMFGGKED